MLVLFVVMFCLVVLMFCLYVREHKDNVFMRTVPPIEVSNKPRSYYCLYDEVGKEMLFSPFYAFNNASAIRQVQEIVKNPNVFPSSLHKEDVSLYYLYTMDAGSLHITEPSEIDFFSPFRLSKCADEDLKFAYEKFKEVK